MLPLCSTPRAALPSRPCFIGPKEDPKEDSPRGRVGEPALGNSPLRWTWPRPRRQPACAVARMPFAPQDGGALFDRVPSEACAELHRRWAACHAKYADAGLPAAASGSPSDDGVPPVEVVLALLYSALSEGDAARCAPGLRQPGCIGAAMPAAERPGAAMSPAALVLCNASDVHWLSLTGTTCKCELLQHIVACARRCKQHLERGDAGLRALAAGQLLALAAPYYPHLRPQARPALLDLAAALVGAQAQACVPLRAACSPGRCRRRCIPMRTAPPSSHALLEARLQLGPCMGGAATAVRRLAPPVFRARRSACRRPCGRQSTSSALPSVLAAAPCRVPLGSMRGACKHALGRAHRPRGRASERPRRAGRRGAVLRAAAPRALGLRGARQRVAGGAAGGGAGAGGAVARARARARAVHRLHAAAVRAGARARCRQGSSVLECTASPACAVLSCACMAMLESASALSALALRSSAHAQAKVCPPSGADSACPASGLRLTRAARNMQRPHCNLHRGRPAQAAAGAGARAGRRGRARAARGRRRPGRAAADPALGRLRGRGPRPGPRAAGASPAQAPLVKDRPRAPSGQGLKLVGEAVGWSPWRTQKEACPSHTKGTRTFYTGRCRMNYQRM